MLQKKKNIKFVVGFIILFIFILGFFLRAQETLSGNFLFLLDSGRDMMDVKKIVFDQKITLIGPYTSLGGVFQGPLYYYLLAIPTFLFKGNPWGNIFLMLIISLLTMAVTFFFMRKYFGLIPAVITLAFFAVSPEAIAAATFFWNPHPMWLIISFYIFALYGSVNKSRPMMLFLFPLIALSFHFEMAFGVFLLAATIIYILIFKRFLFKERYFWIGAIGSLIFFIPQILFDLRHDFIMTRSVLDILNGNNHGLVASSDKVGLIVNMFSNLNTFKDNFSSAFINYKPFTNFSNVIFVLSFGIFIYAFRQKSFSKEEEKFLHLSLYVAAIIFIFGLFYPFPLRYWFLTGFQVFYFVSIGLLLAKIYKFNFGKIIIAIIGCIFLATSIIRLNVLYFNPPDDGGVAKIKGKEAAIDYIYQDAGSNKFNILIFTPPVMTDAYNYLFWWYGGGKYGFVPEVKKSGIVYLLMEPDPGNPSSYNGWLETVVKTGKVLKTKTLPSGIIIQKRDFNL